MEGVQSVSGVNLRPHLIYHLRLKYGVDFHSKQEKFTIATDCAVARERMVNRSVSNRLIHRVDKWMRCVAELYEVCLSTLLKHSGFEEDCERFKIR